MTQIEKIRNMSAEELAEWLIGEVEQERFFNDFCDGRYCDELAAHEDDNDFFCFGQRCLAAAVRYLESEVEEK